MSQPLRIAMFVGQFPVISETFILRQITSLLDAGHQVDIFADTRGDTAVMQPEVREYGLLERTWFMDMPPECAPWELPAWPLDGQTWLPGADKPISNWRRLADAFPTLRRCHDRAPALTDKVMSEEHFGHQARSLSALYRLDRLMARTREYDVLHAHFGPVGESFRFARELWNAPLVVSFHGYDFTTLPRLHGTGMYARLFADADAVTVNSNFTRERVASLGCPAEKIRLLPVGLDLLKLPFLPRAQMPGEPVRLLTVARLVEIKGHEWVLRAVAQLRAKHPNLRYEIVGDGPLRKKLEELVVELGLQETVTLHGAQDGSYIAGLMASSHLGVLASVSIEGDAEGQGLFLQEAQACGLPVIATQHGALPEGLAAGESGFLVPERDVNALTERLEFLVTHPDAWPVMGRAGREFVEQRYDVRKLTGRLTDIHRDAMAAFQQAWRSTK